MTALVAVLIFPEIAGRQAGLWGSSADLPALCDGRHASGSGQELLMVDKGGFTQLSKDEIRILAVVWW